MRLNSNMQNVSVQSTYIKVWLSLTDFLFLQDVFLESYSYFALQARPVVMGQSQVLVEPLQRLLVLTVCGRSEDTWNTSGHDCYWEICEHEWSYELDVNPREFNAVQSQGWRDAAYRVFWTCWHPEQCIWSYSMPMPSFWSHQNDQCVAPPHFSSEIGWFHNSQSSLKATLFKGKFITVLVKMEKPG